MIGRTSSPGFARTGGWRSARHLPLASPPPVGRGTEGEGFSRGPGMTVKARALRLNPTKAERVLWQVLRRDALGLRFRRQMPVLKRFILDFYAPSIRLAVEVDGSQHADSHADGTRTHLLNAHGISVLRFWNNDVLQNLSGVTAALRDVIDTLQADASPLTPLRSGGGERIAHLNFSMGQET